MIFDFSLSCGGNILSKVQKENASFDISDCLLFSLLVFWLMLLKEANVSFDTSCSIT